MIKNGGYIVFSIRKDVFVRLELFGKFMFNVVLKIVISLCIFMMLYWFYVFFEDVYDRDKLMDICKFF